MLDQNKSDKQFLKPEPDEMSANDFVHEFNNLLTAIISNLSIARMDSSPESDLDNTLLEAESAAHEAIELTKQFFLSNYTAVAGKPRKEVQFDEQNSFSGDRRVLVVDDDKRAGVAMCKMLEHLSFKVEYVGEGSAAIERYKQAKHPFDLVILDLVIPGKEATDTLKELRQYDPNVKARVCSGYLNDPIMENFQEYGFEAAITKPYEITELNKILNRVLLDSSQ